MRGGVGNYPRTENPISGHLNNGKEISKWFRIGVEGDTCDGRVISVMTFRKWRIPSTRASTVAASPRTPARHSARQCAQTLWRRAEVKAEIISDDSALNGKKALLAKSHRWTNWSAWCAAVRKLHLDGDPP